MDRVGLGVESCKIVFLEVFPIHMFGHFCCRVSFSHKTLRHRSTDRRRQYLANSQYDRLRTQ